MALNKLCLRCQCIIPYTEKICDKCKETVGTHRSIRDRLYYNSRKDKEYQAIYNSLRWKKLRTRIVARANGLCEECIKKGKINYYDDVHHKIPIKDDITKAYDENNLVCLCRSCHIEAHKQLDKTV
ncbi:HNH endonuclease [uncultured Clostridium sp.]|uniref:HNH endonuclease n=1 Tax=uncultured Clostridium sp. TaxID=59620 RepID=UPI00263010F3|nr:HNH endonuclease signature motif containing protein [uncultured Clostridium sp.]